MGCGNGKSKQKFITVEYDLLSHNINYDGNMTIN